MDLHTTRDRPSNAEKAAVDALLGPPSSGSEAGARLALDMRTVSAGSARRDLLLPVLHAIQERIGWISPGSINYLALRLNLAPAEIHGVASFYAMFSLEPRVPAVAHVCDDVVCLARGASRLCSELEAAAGPPASQDHARPFTWLRTPCLGLCDRAPAALITVCGESPEERVLAPATAVSIESELRDAAEGRLSLRSDDRLQQSIPKANGSALRLLRRIGHCDPSDIRDYQRLGGYEALRRAFEIGPEQIVQEVIDSRILGRGGAAFPVGRKWQALLRKRRPDAVHFVVCNADESEPGTFKDRVLMEGDPFAILEGMTIAAFAVGAQKGYIYIRGEYPAAAGRLFQAMDAARSAGLLGPSILGSGFAFDVELRRGAGAYICGEETALFNSIEGFRGEPRNKPPFPTQAGLFHSPTVVNNVETLANIPEIILHGAAAYARIGTPQSSGYRLFCVSGNIRHPGVYEVPFGVTLRGLIDRAGGVEGTGRLEAVLLGGAAGSFLSPSELDMILSFEGARAAGATLGSGAVIVFDDSINLREILARIARFFHEETCGQCVPCRVGTMRQTELLQRLADRRPLVSVDQELHLLQEIAQAMRDASICGLGQTASSAILSAITRWSLYS